MTRLKPTTKTASLIRCRLLGLLGLAFVLALPAMADDGLGAAIDLYQKKNFKAAAQAFWPQTTGTRAATASYYLALCYIQLGSPAEAKVLFERIVKQWPDSPEGKLAAAYLAGGAQSKPANSEAKTENPKSAAQLEKDELFKPISKAEWEALPLKTRIPVQRDKGHLWVNAKINGHYCKMIFDTGASVCCVSAYDYPDLFSIAQLKEAKIGAVSRTYGVVPTRVLKTEIAVQDITRTCTISVIGERGCNVIGQNFFREYSYQVDDFYLRLTKSTYPGDLPAKVADNQKLADNPKVAYSQKVVDPKASPAKSAVVILGSASNRTNDRYSVPFEVVSNCMFITADINRKPVRVCFDTGCAPDGIVINPRFSKEFGVVGNRIERFDMGPLNLRDVKVYYASGILEPLIGPKIFNRPYTVDPVKQIIKFDY